MIDGAIILDCTTQKTEPRYKTENIRSLAPFALHDVFVQRDIPSTVINYTDFWNPDILVLMLEMWAEDNNIKKPLILCSTMFNTDLLNSNTSTTRTIRGLLRHFNAKLIIGGPINFVDYNIDSLRPHAVFQGRSLHLFERWLDGNILPHLTNNCVELYHDTSSTIKENPIVPKLYDDFCLNSDDIINFETRLGCKFNCTFCTFEFRNAKDVSDATSEQLTDFFLAAKAYGVTNFGVADDTFNEDDSKIHTLHNAVSQLPFTPRIVGYNRFDLMMAKPEQAYMLDECGFHGHYFGIETLHHEASKLIRKGIRKERAFEFMHFLKDTFPHWYTCSGYIVGLPREPAEHIWDTIAEIRDEKLLSAIIPNDLGLYNIPGNEHNFSEFTKNPEKFGITVTGTGIDAQWKHDLMTKDEASALARRIAAKNEKHGLLSQSPWEWISKELHSDDYHIADYMRRKMEYHAS